MQFGLLFSLYILAVLVVNGVYTAFKVLHTGVPHYVRCQFIDPPLFGTSWNLYQNFRWKQESEEKRESKKAARAEKMVDVLSVMARALADIAGTLSARRTEEA
ncbi:hypothetical protein R1sor_000652 [Riccia sorocarpa]|uniref:Innexin n=1 Tax=Riccia sorocarpa TaxID=122646 RepID=A0ABD3GWY0_9MARC